MNFNIEALEIESITPDYYKKNLELLNSTIKESHFIARVNEITYEESYRFFFYYLKLSNTVYLIALHDNNLIGHIFALPRAEELISHVVSVGYIVNSNYRNRGIGSILMQQLISEVNKKKNVKIMVAEVASDNIASQNLLRKFDFEELGRLYNGFMKKNHTFIDLLYFSKYL